MLRARLAAAVAALCASCAGGLATAEGAARHAQQAAAELRARGFVALHGGAPAVAENVADACAAAALARLDALLAAARARGVDVDDADALRFPEIVLRHAKRYDVPLRAADGGGADADGGAAAGAADRADRADDDDDDDDAGDDDDAAADGPLLRAARELRGNRRAPRGAS